jgi:hypothetical protein
MRHASRTILTLFSVGALLLGGCNDDGRDATDGSKGGGESLERPSSPSEEPPTIPDEPPTIEGPLLDVSRYGSVGYSPDDDNEHVARIILADPLNDSPRNGVYIYVRADTQILGADNSGGWRTALVDEVSEGGETLVWNRRDEPLDHRLGGYFEAKTIAFRPPAVPPGRPTSPPPWNAELVGSVSSVVPCPSIDRPAICTDGVIATVVAQDIRDPDPDDILADVTADTTILVHDGTTWVPGSIDQATDGAPIRVWSSEYQFMKTRGSHQGLAETIAIGPVDLW